MVSILIVEDDPNYQIPLQEMYRYRSLLPEADIDIASGGYQAIQKLRNTRYDILSLDINLYSQHPTKDNKPNYKISGANGFDVIECASERNACTGVIVFTGIMNDPELEQAIPDDNKRNQYKMNPQTVLDEYFSPSNYEMRYKDAEKSFEENIQILRNSLSREKLLSLCTPPKYLIKVENIAINCNKSRHRLKVTIKVSSDNRSIEIENERYNRLLSELLEAKDSNPNNPIISFKKIYQISQNSQDGEPETLTKGEKKKADSFISSLKRDLKNMGINWHYLIQNKRGQGYKFYKQVERLW